MMQGMESNGKKVSIIVPVYNAAPYLGRCMESLSGQSYGNLEILFIDDGSVDGSGRICDGYAGRYGNVRVFHTENKGVSSARNFGMEVCSGEYLMFADADDILAEDMVERLVRMIEEASGDVAGCGYFLFYGGSREEKEKGNRRKRGKGRIEDGQSESGILHAGGAAGQERKVFSGTEVLSGKEFIEKGILNSDTRCWSKLYRKESVGELRFDTGLTVGEDMLFLLELARRGKVFCRSGYEGYGYYINEKGAMLQAFRDSFMDQIACWQRALKIVRVERADLVNRAEAILLISVMLVAGKLAVLSRGERKEKGKYAARCLHLARKYGRKKEVFRELDRGYRIKVKVYCRVPELYMLLYRFLQYVKTLRLKDFLS